MTVLACVIPMPFIFALGATIGAIFEFERGRRDIAELKAASRQRDHDLDAIKIQCAFGFKEAIRVEREERRS